MGVAYTFNPLFHPDSLTETRTVCGTKLVILSAGSFGTPGILERLGIGAKAILEGVGVIGNYPMTPEDYDNKFSIVPSVPLKQRIELPSIGENYQGPSLNQLSPTVHVADFGT